jgi:serine/threonine protein kinase
MNYFSKASIVDKVRYDRSLMTAGLELHYDVNLDEVLGAGGQGDVFKAQRKFDKLQVAIKVTPRSRLRPGPGVCSHLDPFKTKKINDIML